MKYNDILDNPLFDIYYKTLRDWNQKINLTTVTERDEVYLKHFYDSILPFDLIPDGSAVLDIGSGAGFPGIPLKIINPSLDLVLIDSVRKKVDFLGEIISVLNLNGITAQHTRVEDYARKNFDVVTSRAVAPLNTLLEYCLPFVKVGGFMLAYKGKNLDEELNLCNAALDILGGKIESIIERPLCEDTLRRFVIVRKIRPCPPKYPRSGNKPRLLPL